MGDAKYKQRQIAKGLCRDCSRPTSGLTRLCRLHRERQRLDDERKNKQSRERFRQEGKCVRCGGPLDEEMDGGCVDCLTCRQRGR